MSDRERERNKESLTARDIEKKKSDRDIENKKSKRDFESRRKSVTERLRHSECLCVRVRERETLTERKTFRVGESLRRFACVREKQREIEYIKKT